MTENHGEITKTRVFKKSRKNIKEPHSLLSQFWGPANTPRSTMPPERQRQTPTSPPTDSSEEVPGVIDAVRQLLAAIDRNPEYVAGILHATAHRDQLDSLRNAIERASDQAAVWQRPKGGGRQWHASNKAPPREPSPSAPSAPSTARTQQSTGASSSTRAAPPVVTPTMVPPNVTAVTWDQLQEMRADAGQHPYRTS